MAAEVAVADAAATVFDTDDDVAIVVGLDLALGLVNDDADEVEALEMRHDLGSLVLSADGGKVAEPVERAHRVEGVLYGAVAATLDLLL